MTDRFDDIRHGAERAPGHDARLSKLERELAPCFDGERGFSEPFQRDLDGLKEDIRAQQHAQETRAPSYHTRSGILPAGYKPHHDILLSEEMKGLDADQIERHAAYRALKAGLEQQGLTCTVTTSKVWDDGAYGPRGGEDAFMRSVSVRHLDGAELRDPPPRPRNAPSFDPEADARARERINTVRQTLRDQADRPQGIVGRLKGLFGR
jgi:hypothetical protein